MLKMFVITGMNNQTASAFGDRADRDVQSNRPGLAVAGGFSFRCL
jgi:hypothetical protein